MSRLAGPHEKIHVLLIEDNPDDTFIINQLLAMDDYARFKSFNIRHVEQIESLSNNIRFDVILISLHVGEGFNKLTLCRSLLDRTPIIVLSDDELVVDEKVIQQGAHDLIPKIYLTAESLSRAIRFACARSRHVNQVNNTELSSADIAPSNL